MVKTTVTIRERVWTDNGTNGFYDTFVYEPSNADERKLGSLFIAGALLAEKPSDNEAFLLNSVASLARRSFYNPPSRSESLSALEYSLRQVNAFLGKQAEEGALEWFGNLHIVIGCMDASSDIHVGQTGNTNILLIRDGKAHNIATLTESGDKIKDSSSHLRVFSAIASGTINASDIIFISSPSIPDMQNAIIGASQDPTVDFFTLMHNNASPCSYASILLDARKESANSNRPFIDTLEKNFSEESDTIAEPLPLEEIVEAATKEKTPEPMEEEKEPQQKSSKNAKKIPPKKKRKLRHTATVARVLKNIPKPNFSTINAMKATLAKSTGLFNRAQLMRLSRYPFNIIIIVTIIVIIMVVLTVASATTTPAPQAESPPTNELASITASFTNITPTPIANISSNPFAFTATGLVLLANEHVLYSNKSGSLYRIVANQDPQFVLFAANDGFQAATKQNDKALLLSKTGSLFSYGASQQPPIDLPISYDPNNVIDITIFRNSIYLLQNNGAIYKYTANKTGVYEETLWAETGITNPTSFSIDGSIYIANTTGVITEYLKGKQIQSFKIESNTTSSLDLYTTSASPSLVAVAPINKTVTVINKETLEKTSYKILHSEKIRASAFDIENNALYLLSGTELSKIKLD